MEEYIQKVKSYITGQFNHFSKVTGYTTKVEFEVTSDEAPYVDVSVKIDGLGWSQVSHKHHSKRLYHLCEKIEKKYGVSVDVINTKEKPLTPEQQAFHDATTHNRESIERSKRCGCYYCGYIFPASEITDDNYIDEGTTACCPNCDMDTVYGDASGIQLTPEHLKKLHRKWFGED